jgi:preprotein translocase subunit SecG
MGTGSALKLVNKNFVTKMTAILIVMFVQMMILQVSLAH